MSPHFARAGGGVALPARVEILASGDGAAFRPVAVVEKAAALRRRGWFPAVPAEPLTARFLKVRPTPGGEWTFIDEVAVNAPPLVPDVRHAALGRPAVLAFPPHEDYAAPGIEGLTDGFRARGLHCAGLAWLGFEWKRLEATIDLGEPVEIRRAGGSFLQFVGAGIFIPAKVEVLLSDDGKGFRAAGAVVPDRDDRAQFIREITVDLRGARARYVRVVAQPGGEWLFADEVLVDPEGE